MESVPLYLKYNHVDVTDVDDVSVVAVVVVEVGGKC